MSQISQDQQQQTIAGLTLRVERTEGRLKQIRFAIPGLAILAGLAVFISMQLNKPAVIRAKSVIAESFTVRSPKGDIVAQLSVSEDGSPSIAFLDANKKIRLMATVGANGPSVSLLDPQEVTRAILSLNDKSEPSFTMSNADKLTRSVLAVDKSGSGHLVLYGNSGGLDLAANGGRIRWTPSGGAPIEVLPAAK